VNILSVETNLSEDIILRAKNCNPIWSNVEAYATYIRVAKGGSEKPIAKINANEEVEISSLISSSFLSSGGQVVTEQGILERDWVNK
jgi:hypothetical protein